jgi:hypothetical protein
MALGPRFRGDERLIIGELSLPLVPAEAGTQLCTNLFPDVESYPNR